MPSLNDVDRRVLVLGLVRSEVDGVGSEGEGDGDGDGCSEGALDCFRLPLFRSVLLGKKGRVLRAEMGPKEKKDERKVDGLWGKDGANGKGCVRTKGKVYLRQKRKGESVLGEGWVWEGERNGLKTMLVVWRNDCIVTVALCGERHPIESLKEKRRERKRKRKGILIKRSIKEDTTE